LLIYLIGTEHWNDGTDLTDDPLAVDLGPQRLVGLMLLPALSALTTA
jgi:hypothetical protein